MQDVLRHIYIMDAGPEFVYSEKELELIAENLINNEENPVEQIDKMKKRI